MHPNLAVSEEAYLLRLQTEIAEEGAKKGFLSNYQRSNPPYVAKTKKVQKKQRKMPNWIKNLLEYFSKGVIWC